MRQLRPQLSLLRARESDPEESGPTEDQRVKPVPTMRPPPAKTASKRTVCNSDDFLILLEYLEDNNNFDKLFGAGRKAVGGGKYLKKEAAWEIAAAELKLLGFKETTGKNLNKKWQRYFGKYREAKRLSEQSGGGLTDDEFDKGITLEEKLNDICDHFYKMDALLGTRVNLSPPVRSGPMGFESFFRQSVPECHQPEIVHVSTPSPTRDILDDVPSPPWRKERMEGLAVDLQQGGEEDELDTCQETEIPQSPGPAGDTLANGIESTQPPPVAEADPTHTGPAVLDILARAQNPQPARTKRTPAVRTDQEKGKAGNISKSSEQEKGKGSMTSKSTLANAFQESKAQEAELKYRYIEKKEQWKRAELEDRREGRLAELEDRRKARFDDYKKRRLEMQFEAEQKRLEREELFREQQRERLHKAEASKQRNKLDLIIAGWTNGKSHEHICDMCKLFD